MAFLSLKMTRRLFSEGIFNRLSYAENGNRCSDFNWISRILRLRFFTSAGILTILSIQTTKRKSLHEVYTRVLASIIGMMMAFLFFEGVAYHPIVLGCMILVFLPVLVMLKITPLLSPVSL